MYLTTHTHTLHRRCILTRKETQHTHTQLGKKKSKQRINFNYMLKIHKLFWVERESDAELTANVHLWRRSEGDFDRKWCKITLERGMGNPFFYAASHIGIFLFLRCFFFVYERCRKCSAICSSYTRIFETKRQMNQTLTSNTLQDALPSIIPGVGNGFFPFNQFFFLCSWLRVG